MERLEKREWLALATLAICAGLLLSYLPFSGVNTFLSPDETGVFVAAKNRAEQGSVAVEDKLAVQIPWLHPRSWVSHESNIVPVGFLGWPWITSWFIKMFGDASAKIGAMLIILSCLYPLYRLMRPIGRVSAFIGTIVAITSPAFLLYGNRALFPNAGIISLSLWCAWMFRWLITPLNLPFVEGRLSDGKTPSRSTAGEGKGWVKFVLFGILSTLALAIRPVEAIWIIPWFIVLGWNWRPTREEWKWMGLGAVLVLVPLMWQAQMAYGGFWRAGYWMQDNALITASAPHPQNTYTPELFPFGIHPKSILWNAYSFLAKILFPWMVPLLMMFALVVLSLIKDEAQTTWLERLKKFVSGKRGKYFIVSLWTILFLTLYYGNGRYLDNINGTSTIGNSYIRYLLPIGFISGLALAWLYRILSIARYGRPVIITMAVLLAATGIWRAYAADEEGVLTGKVVILHYASIRESMSQWFKPGDIILSERSDKIFFPAYRAVSPLPPIDEAAKLSIAIEQGITIGLYIRPLSQAQKDAWRKIGLDPVELATFGREKIYRLQSVKP